MSYETQWLADYTFRIIVIVLCEINIKWQRSYTNPVLEQETEIVWFEIVQRWKFKYNLDKYYHKQEHASCDSENKIEAPVNMHFGSETKLQLKRYCIKKESNNIHNYTNK